MRIAVAGGGPAGLYFALLMKRDWPTLDITVIERNRPDDTFGFGVVFSDQTLDTFQAADHPSYEAIRSNFAYWDDIEIHFKGAVHRVGGNGFCGCSRRTLLTLLQERARKLGVNLVFQQEADDPAALSSDYDLVVASDGINSRIRETYKDHFAPETDLRPNRFVWMGSTKPLDAFTFHFRELPEGIVIIHAYQYEPGRSTWIFETDPETYAKLGFDSMSEAESAEFLEKTFAEELGGHKLITNRSLWRQFPMIRCRRWVKDNIVLMGDAKATAHFSIGSGTKLAMEDAIHLHRSFHARGLDVAAALEHYETTRREEVEKTQHAADVSAGLVRACRPVLGFPAHPLRVRPDDALQGDHLRQPRAPRSRVRGRGRSASRRGTGRRGFGCCRTAAQPFPCSSPSACATSGWRTASCSRRCAMYSAAERPAQ